MSVQRKILLILRDFGMMPNPNAYRWNAVVAQWRRWGHEVEVVQLGSGHEKRTTSPSRLPSWIRRLGRTIFWPDSSFLAIPSARREVLRLLAKKEIDTLVSVCLPFSAHWVALSVKKKHTNLFWVADIEDPFALPGTQAKNNTTLYGMLNRWAENRILSQADRVTFTVGRCAERYVAFFSGLTAQKVATVPPLFNAERWEEARQVQDSYRMADRINVGYFGAFYAGVREPEVLFSTWERILLAYPELADKIVLQVFGPFFEARRSVYSLWQKKLGDHLKINPSLPRVAALAASQQMDALINLGNTTDYQLPSKTPDYLATGLPIINIQQHPDCAFAHALADYPGLFTIKFGEKRIELSSGWWEKRYGDEIIASLLAPYRIEAVAGGFIQQEGRQQEY